MAQPGRTADVPMSPDDPGSPPVSVKAEDVAGAVRSVDSKRTRDDLEEQARVDLTRAEDELKEAKEAMKKAEVRWEAKEMPDEGIFADAYKAAMDRVNAAQQRVTTLTDLMAVRATKRARQGHPPERAGALIPFGGAAFEAALARGDEFQIKDLPGLEWEDDPAMSEAASALIEKQPEPLGAGVEWTDGAMLPFDRDQVSDRGLATRECTRAITEEALKDIGEADVGTITVITGSPGIGKTRTLVHIAKRVLEGGGKRAEGQPDGEVWSNVLIFNLKSKRAYLISRRGGRYHAWRAHCLPEADSTVFDRRDVHVLVDPEEAKKGGAKFAHPTGAHLILAASANEKHFDGVSKVELGRKTRSRFVFYTPAWTLAEMEAFRAKLEENDRKALELAGKDPRDKELASVVSAETMQQRFHMVGGAPRYVLDDAQLYERVGQIRQAVRKLSNVMVSEALENGSINGVGENTMPGCFFTFAAMEPGYSRPVVCFLSSFARLVVADHFRAEVIGLARFGDRTQLAVEEGFRLEELVRSDLVLGGTFIVRKLGEKHPSRVTFKACAKDGVVFVEHLGLGQSKEALASLFVENHEEEKEPVRRVLLPCKTFPAIDFADSERRVFQVTINAEHSFKADLVAVVLEAAGILTVTKTMEKRKNGQEVEKTTYEKNSDAKPIAWYWTTPQRYGPNWKSPRSITRGNASAKLETVVKACVKTHLVQHVLLVPEKCPRQGGDVPM